MKHRHLPHLPVPAPDRALERDRLDAGPRPQPPAHRDRGHPVRHCRHLPRDIWTVGGYDTGTRFQPLIEHFNGAHWSLIPAPAPGSALLSRVSLQAPGNGWAVGIGGAVPRTQALIMHWNGHHWAPARSPAIGGSGLAGVLALTPRLAWAAGSYSPRPGVNRTLIERWDGRAWTVTPSPNRRQGSELLGIAGTQQHLWAVGDALTDTLILRH